MRTIPLLVASLLVASWVVGEEEPDLDDPKVREKILKEAVPVEMIEERWSDGEKLGFQAGDLTPYTGWVKWLRENGQLGSLCDYKDGELCLRVFFDLKGQEEHKSMEEHYEDGRLCRRTFFGDDGQVIFEEPCKDGQPHGMMAQFDWNTGTLRESPVKNGDSGSRLETQRSDGSSETVIRYKDGEEVKE